MNNFDLSQFKTGSSPEQKLLEQSRELVDKWSPTGLLEGLEDDHEVHGVSILLENQYQQLLKEASRTGTSEGSEEWSGVALPLVRRVFGEIVAKEFVSVQPMNLPSGLIFYLDFRYGSSQPGFEEGGSVYGKTGTFEDVEGAPSGALYGSGRFGYSVNDQLAQDVSPHAINDVTDARVNFDENLVDRTGDLAGVEVDLPSRVDTEGVRAFTIAAGDISEYYPAHTRYVQENGDGTHRVEFIVLPTNSSTYGYGSGESADDVDVEYHVQPPAYDRGDFEERDDQSIQNAGASDFQPLDIPEIDFDLSSEPIEAKTRKLKAVWTPELAQDLNAYHSIDAEAELTSMLSEYISMEIDLEILDMLIQNALTKEYWSTLPGYEYDPNTGQFQDQRSHTGTKNEWFQTLGNKIQRVSNRIHQKTMRGGANFLVCSPDVATILESIEGFRADTDGTQMDFAMGVQRVGTLNNRFQVYKNPYFVNNVILVGFRGQNFLETGAVYAPYVPLIMTPIVYDPNNFTPRRGVMTRYAKKMVRPEFYGLVVVDKPSRV